MSLLLDALKKAADDKQKASQSPAEAENIAADVTPEERSPATETSHQESVGHEPVEETVPVQSASAERPAEAADDAMPELTLDDIDTEDSPASEVSGTTESQVETQRGEAQEALTLDDEGASSKDPETHAYTVSDDALSMLIYKTNRDVKHNRKIVFISILLMSMAVLITGGVYYYLDMQTEIAALERKHQLSIRSMQSKTSGKNAPTKSDIIRNLVSDSDLDEKVQFAKQVSAGKRNSSTPNAEARTDRKTTTRRADGSTLSIQRTAKNDPVGEKLDQAWLAYEDARYRDAREAYESVLDLEKDNRDALLGLGAIAVLQADSAQARTYYLQLLEFDPHDAIATAALSSLRDGETELKQDEDYLLSLLQKNPDAQHLNFALGNNYARQQKWLSAQQYYFKAWQHDSDNADYLFNLAVSMDHLGKPEQALTFYRDSLIKAQNKQVSFSREAVSRRIDELGGT